MTPAAVLSLLVKTEGVAQAQSQLGKLDTNAKRAGGSFSKIGKAAKSLGPLIGAAGAAGAFKAMNDEYREAQKTGAQTNAVLKSTGGAAKVTKKHIENLAGAISRKAGIDDEAIQQSENMLLTFTKVRNETGKGNKIFDRATQTVTDMSVALGQSGKSSAIQLGKALNDPIKGVTALQRVGVTFDAQQKKQIQTMVKAGDTLGAQKLILGELNKEFSGSAAAQATAGDKLKVSLGNLAEAAGGILVPALDKVATFLTTMIDQVVKGQGVAKFFISAYQAIAPVLAPFIESVKQIVGWLQQNTGVAKVLAAGLGILTGAIIAVNLAMDANPFVLVGLAIAALVVGVVTAYRESETFRKIVDGAFTAIKAVAQAVFPVVAALVTGAWNGIKAVTSAVWPTIKAVVSGYLQALLGVVKVFSGLLHGNFSKAWDGVKQIFSGVGKALAALLKADVGLLLAAGKLLAQAVITGVKAAPGLLMDAGKWVVGRLVAGVKALPGLVADAGGLLAKGLIAAFKAALNLAHEIAQAIRDLLPKIPGYAIGIGKALVQGIVSGIKSVPGLIGDAVKGAIGSVGKAFGVGDGIGKSIGRAVGKEALPSGKGAGSLMGASRTLAPFAAIGARFGLHVSSGRRPGSITSSGNVSYHSSGEAVDLANGQGPDAAKLATFRYLKSHFGARLAELIYTPGGVGIKNGQPFTYTGKVAADHFDHVHVAFDTGRPGVGDGLGRAGRFMGDGLGPNGKRIWQYLLSKGYTPAQAAGIIGNLQQESGLSPTASQPGGPGRGIAQWGGSRLKALKAFAARRHTSWTNLQTQLDFMSSELRGPYAGAGTALRGAHTVAAATDIFGRQYERYGVAGNRAGYARQAFNAFKNVGAPGKRSAHQKRVASHQSAHKQRLAAQKATDAAVSPLDMQSAQADLAIAQIQQNPANIARNAVEAMATRGKEKIVGQRIQRIRKALAGHLTPATRLRLTQELTQRLGEHKELGARVQELLHPAAAAVDTGGGVSTVDTGGGGDPNQALIDSNAALQESIDTQVAAQKEHDDLLVSLNAELKRQTDFATSVTATSNYQLTKSLADILGGQIVGYGVAGRRFTPSTGVEYAY